MADAVAHYRRVWDAMIDDPGIMGRCRLGVSRARTSALVMAFVMTAVLDQRAVVNVMTQWEIDADSIVEQSLAELRNFKSCLAELFGEEDTPAQVRDAYTALADYFIQISNHADARTGLRAMWREIIPQLRTHADGGRRHG